MSNGPSHRDADDEIRLSAPPASGPRMPAPPEGPTVTWELSPTYGKIFAALARAQRVMKPAKKSGTGHAGPDGNRAYKYSTIDDVIDAIQEPLGAEGIVRFQTTENVGPHAVSVVTWLGCEGEYIRTRLWMPCDWYVDRKTGKQSPPDTQDFGTALSYARRYALTAITGLPSEDNDAARERAVPQAQAKAPARTSPAPIVHRDPKPENVPQRAAAPAARAPDPVPVPAPAAAGAERGSPMSEREQRAVAEYGPKFAAARTEAAIVKLRSEIWVFLGKGGQSPRFLMWAHETLRAARAAIGSDGGPGPVKAAPLPLALVPRGAPANNGGRR